MRKLPPAAKLFVVVVSLLGFASCIGALLSWRLVRHASVWEVLLFLILAGAAGGKRIHLNRSKEASDAGSMSLGFIITFSGLLHFGPGIGWLVGVLGCLSGCLFPKRQPLFQIVFNVSLTGVQTWIAGTTLYLLNGQSLSVHPLTTFQAVAGSTLLYYAINTGSVATVVALSTGQSAIKLWKNTFLWTAPGYFAGACVGTLSMMLFGSQLVPSVLFLLPVVFLTYQSYGIYVSRVEEKQKHIEELRINQAQLADLYLATIKSLALAIDAKDQYTHQHILRVQRYAVATAERLGLTGAELEGVNTGALLHDIGKLGVPEYVLLKPGPLTEEEFEKIKKHPEIGAAILDPVDFPWPVLPAVKHHHEKWDGTGYPDGLSGEGIPLQARILAVADVYDALTSSRAYRNAWTHERAIETISKDSGTHFDPRIVDAFMEVINPVLAEMAEDGLGPLVVSSADDRAMTSKSAQAVRDIQRASSELWALYEVAQTLSASLGLQDTIDILVRKLEAIFPGITCLFLLKDESEERLSVRSAAGFNQEFFLGAHTISHFSRSWSVAQTQKSYLGEYDRGDLMLNGVQTAQWIPLEASLIVPIIHQGEVLGTINGYACQENAFGIHDQQLLEAIAERAALALYNGVLYDRTRGDALTDQLTGLYNVRYLTDYVDKQCRLSEQLRALHPDPSPELIARHEDRFALLCLDLDSFKPINDNFGHQKGDEVLRDLSRVFRETVRDRDVVTRYGGDEFLFVLHDAGSSEAEAMAVRLQEAVERYDPKITHPKLGSLRLGASIGYACFPEHGHDCASLLSAADMRMYADKTERKLGRMVGEARRAPAAFDDPDYRAAA